MPSQSESPGYSLSQLAQNMFSDDNNSNIMLAAIVSLLLVILFVLLLHVYARWFLSQAQLHSHTRRRQSPATVSGVLEPSHFHSINIESSPTCTKGLDSATVSAIPMFVHGTEKTEESGETGETEELECVICLSLIEEGEVGRSLPKCGHAFHVECIDMWLSSHCNCPICRAPIVVVSSDSELGSVDSDGDGVFEIVVVTPGYEISESEREDDGDGDSVPETFSSLLGCSWKRLLSKVFVSSDVMVHNEI
ncbi:RING-H2 finger protein ATL63 [Cajanus cajan]|uniref:RING-type E3 ubiquitin transferase n=1 Tax=Cajanus cajan TaxID=3821 RepID=A0A151RT41_CAJCA|nr:RING-H2 finger protein ATL63 [Cajanus cajan]KYP45720.1 RING-H2 finger protein ATL3F [Cajanus cajan]